MESFFMKLLGCTKRSLPQGPKVISSWKAQQKISIGMSSQMLKSYLHKKILITYFCRLLYWFLVPFYIHFQWKNVRQSSAYLSVMKNKGNQVAMPIFNYFFAEKVHEILRPRTAVIGTLSSAKLFHVGSYFNLLCWHSFSKRGNR